MSDQFHFSGIDWIRALSSIAVVALHYEVIMPDQDQEVLSLGGLIYAYLFRLAVPMFILVSLFLFTKRKRTLSYLVGRINTLLFLAIIWPFFFYLANGGILGYINTVIGAIKKIKDSPNLIIYYVFSDLETVFYYFIMLQLVLTLAFILQNMNTKLIIATLVLSIIAIAILPFFSQGKFATFYNPINFIPYVPVAILVTRYNLDSSKKKFQIGLMFLLAGFFIIIFELKIMLLTGINFLGGHTKNSLILISVGLLLMSLITKKNNNIIKFMSDQSLPLYLFHTCLYAIVGTIYQIYFVKLINIPIIYSNFFRCLIAIILSYLISTFIAPRILSPAIYRP